ncbi:SNF2 DOMAIN-CONTAINING PROTEIN CLASSY 2-RELATED [Salix koriyanagi]|uniref:SNF2 DOMAIN-CONTAINING PROTEIN CLASSY 2-RELATED n=1 Tax=Salix koriyanagi TaxID=2511006 RepID=A0A9Q0PP16_9ROSI|nr:SNF2 DOMAIN-CONTAINING PROTEIN CLASSY 2-RELATED [Salix koriyanagi]
MKRKRLHESRHPFNALPFEALCCGSWQSVELLQIRDGAMTVHFVDSHHSIEENGPFSNIRVKSRKATLSDCTCFLRPGVDVCVLSSSERAKNTGEGNSEPVWVDAKISSIKRKPHGRPKNKIVYQILGGHISDTNGTKQSPCYDVASLRRSKRQNVQPERFLACDAPAETEIGWVRSLPYMPLKWKAAEDDDEEMHLPLAYLFGTHASASCTEEQTRTEVGVGSLKLELLEGIPVSRTKTGLKEIRSIVVNRREHHTELGEVQAGMGKRIEHRKSGAVNRRKRQKSTMADRIEHQTRLGDAESGMANRKKHGTQIKEVKLGVANRREHNDQLAIVPVHTEDVLKKESCCAHEE